jgi:antitoxin component of MazEF toxin-antitoxin module
MTTNLKTLGDELAVVIDRSTLEALGIDKSTRLEVSVEGGDIRIRPILDEHRARILASAHRMMDLHDETFRKLAQ